jgi:hypothetical protein
MSNDDTEGFSFTPSGGGKTQPTQTGAPSGVDESNFSFTPAPGSVFAPKSYKVAPTSVSTPATFQPRPGVSEEELQRYADMPLSEVATSAAQNLIPSAKKAFTDVGHAIMNPSETLEAFKQVGQGAYSKVSGALGGQRNPQAEQILDALGAHYGEQYGTKGGFKRALATDPFSVGMDVSLPLTLGASALPKSLGAVSKAASIAGTLMDPIQSSLAVAKGVGQGAGAVMRQAQSASTGVSPNLLKAASEAGSTSDPVLRGAFLSHLSGKGDPAEIADVLRKSITETKTEDSARLLAERQKLGLSNTVSDLSHIDSALAEARKRYSRIPGTFEPANEAINKAEVYINNFKNFPASEKTLDTLDNLKQSMWDLRGQTSNDAAKSAVDQIYHGVKNSLVAHDAQYATVMEKYQNYFDKIKSLETGLGSRGESMAAINKMLKQSKTSTGQSLLNKITSTEAGAKLPYMLAGHALKSFLPGGGRNIIDAALLYGSAAFSPHALWGILASSPRTMGEVNYRLGQASKLSPLVSQPATYGAYQIGNVMRESQTPQAPSGDVGRVLNTIKARESGGTRDPYRATTQGSSASGAYQITDPTWRDWTRKYGIGTQYSSARHAPPEVQDAVAARAVEDILAQHGGDVSKVPLVWYTGNSEGRISPEALALNRGLTPQTYQQNWMRQHGMVAATGGRIERREGGRVGIDHSARAASLVRAAETAKKQESKTTEPLLQAPDERIVKALSLANEAI